MKKIIIGLMLLVSTYPLFGQVDGDTLTLKAQAPEPVRVGSYSNNGTAGTVTYYYWIIANYPIGKSTPFGPIVVTTAHATLDGVNYITLNWAAPNTAVVSYDILRTTTNILPSSGNSLVHAAVAALTTTDKSNTVSSYSLSSTGGTNATMVLDNRSYSSPTFVMNRNLAGVSLIPGVATPSYKNYRVTKIANATGNCATTKGCWSVNSQATPTAAAAAVTQTFTWLAAPANAILEGVQIKTVTACVGIAALSLTQLGTTASATEFSAALTYDLKAAVSATNVLWPALSTPGLTRAATNWNVTLDGGAGNIDDVTNGCSFDIEAKWAVLP